MPLLQSLIESIPIANPSSIMDKFFSGSIMDNGLMLPEGGMFLGVKDTLRLDDVVAKVTELDFMDLVSHGVQLKELPKLLKEEIMIEGPLSIVAELKESFPVPDILEKVLSTVKVDLSEHSFIEDVEEKVTSKITDVMGLKDEMINGKLSKLLEAEGSLEEFAEFVFSIVDEVREEFSLNYIKMLDQIMETFSQTMARIESLVPEDLTPEKITELLKVESEKVNYVADKGFSLIDKFYEISDELIAAKFSFFYDVCSKKPEWDVIDCVELIEKIQVNDAAMRQSLRDNVAVSFFFARDVLDTLLKQSPQ